MIAKWTGRLILLGVIAGIAAAFYYAMREQPLNVDIAVVERAPMQVTVDEEGTTRVRDVFVISAPIAGRLDRITLEEGDLVAAEVTQIASIRPLDPPLHDERTEADLRAAVEAAKSAVAVAELETQRASTALTLAQSEFRRATALAEKDFVSASRLERAENDLRLQEAQVAATEASISLRKAELASAEARLRQPDRVKSSGENGSCCIQVLSPIDGVVLKVIARSAQAIAPGATIAELGDLSDLEITVDLLSEDAVRVAPGTPAAITDWGGADLPATVRLVEPAGFTKVSALGIEEQRVNAVVDFDDPVPDSLGHGFRVVVRIALWSSDDALQIPVGALFRDGGDWVVFAVEKGIARLRHIEVGHMNDTQVEIVSGLREGEQVVLFPSDTLADGREIVRREH